MSQNSLVPASFQSIRSLPGDFRFAGSPASDCLEKSEDWSSGNVNVIASSIPEYGNVGGGVVGGAEGTGSEMEQALDDSPYGGNVVSVDDRPLVGDEDLDSVASYLPSISPSSGDHRWGDTTSYAAKKVFCGF